jgi:hypothetical protein
MLFLRVQLLCNKISCPLLIVYVSDPPKPFDPYNPLVSGQFGTITIPYPDHFPFVMYSHTIHGYVRKSRSCLREKI